MNKVLDNMLNLRSLILLLLVIGSGPKPLLAQSGTSSSRLVLHITGLTATERDAIAEDLQAEGTAQVTYACVPAGIIVITLVQGAGALQRSTTLLSVDRTIPAARITESTDDQASIEAQCQATR
ncbi:MAG: hypothetical protein H6595_00800 [Flavobacteriales bacterium]|nr:hypothetical protein [Flavobacteriales bacterium]